MGFCFQYVIKKDFCQPYIPFPDDLQDLRVTLVWTDPAASTGSTSALIHDLDLVVIAQSTGAEYYPNGGDEADTVNNVEKVIITDTTEMETYTIRVRVSTGLGGRR